jgi:hypothetical protein
LYYPNNSNYDKKWMISNWYLYILRELKKIIVNYYKYYYFLSFLDYLWIMVL